VAGQRGLRDIGRPRHRGGGGKGTVRVVLTHDSRASSGGGARVERSDNEDQLVVLGK